MVLRPPDSWSNWNLEMLVFEERGKPEYPEKNLSEQRREPTTDSTHIWRRRRELNPGHIGGRRVLSPRRHPCSPREFKLFTAISTYSRQFQLVHVHGNFNLLTAISTCSRQFQFTHGKPKLFLPLKETILKHRQYTYFYIFRVQP